MENNIENMLKVIDFFCGLFNAILVIDGLLTFLDFLILPGGVISLTMLHVHIAHPCLCLQMSNSIAPKHTSSNRARAKKLYCAWVHSTQIK